ncbi:iron-containing redox enzyme family protein [Rhodococcus sp. ABRD24]|uniref:iron-containing redox enzyme family protein n=1 Tax=Rhodococcus sp. ABRD24 TaxID=2507582 RepID=UPI001039B301|nr:iron-containing redox enzyme family protein [Rhodococcus sp. ABRD24]QBJ95957.1 iron-containing redox enzyme family protein [Rhodococcus sp. ABRD24]
MTSVHHRTSSTAMPVPSPRGPASAALLSVLRGDAAPRIFVAAARMATAPGRGLGVLVDDDIQLCLTLLYELHLQGIDGVDDRWGWDAELLTARAALEAPFDSEIRALAAPVVDRVAGPDVVAALWDMTAPSTSPGLSGFMATEATVEQFRELLIHRSLNQLREGDVHTLGIPRLAGRPKAALVEVQADEYGGGRLERMHSQLFAITMRELGLSDAYAHYVDAVPAVTLASLNALSYFGSHRSMLGALAGHLCAVETTSALPSKKYAAGLRRLGFGDAAALFFDEHIEADSVHEQIVVRDLAGGLAAARPELVDDILLGAAACLAFDDLIGDHIAECWARGSSSLRS